MLQRYGRAEADDEADALEPPAQGGEYGGFGVGFAPQTPPRGLPNAQPTCKAALTPLQNAREDSDGQGDVFRADAPEAVFRAFAEGVEKDAEPLARELRKLLALIDAGDEAGAAAFAATLGANIGDYLPDDPAGAMALAEAMAERYGEAWEAARRDDSHAEARRGGGGELANSECRAKDPAHCPTHGTPREPETKPHHDRYGSTDESTLVSDSQKNFKRGANALEAMERMQGGYIDKAMFREETGWIRFDWGTKGDPDSKPVPFAHGHGISHILAKHGPDAKKLPDVIARGEAKTDLKDPRATILVTDTAYAVVVPLMQGQRRIITMYEPKPDSTKLAAIKNYPPAPKLQGKKGG